MSHVACRSGLLVATSCLSLSFASAALAAEDDDGVVGYELEAGIDLSGSGALTSFEGLTLADLPPLTSEDAPLVVPGGGLDPNAPPPNGILDDVNINGIGQMVAVAENGGLGSCTGSLINPRTVIFAAHCVNTRAAEAYGAQTGGTPISFGFQQNNIPGLLNWLGFNDSSRLYRTDVDTAIYNVEHVWYDPRSLEAAFGLNFIEADIAIATLDTPALDIPTWALLFSPLDGPTDVIVTGYGRTGSDGSLGANLSGGFRRRAAENVVSFLGSLDDRSRLLFGEVLGGAAGDPTFPQTLYQTDFDSPGGTGAFDFDIFDGEAREREGTTGPGDSGGPLIVENRFDEQVVAGVLSGGSRFFGASQPFSSYGTVSFYQPLFMFWDTIVENNPYVYATNAEGDGQWTDPDHWVQQMDPAYRVIRDGELVNALPGERGVGVSSDTSRFGTVCFFDTCVTETVDGGEDAGTGAGLVIEGGPGSTGFVPDNRTGIPGVQRPRYYDVTLAASGTTTLSGADITIDRLTLDGATKLDIASDGSLRALGDFTQFAGWTNVDGTLQTNEAFLMTGILTGSGTFVAPFLTTAAVTVAPGGADNFGTLTIDGNMIMASGSALYIDASRDGADKLAVTGTLSLSDPTDASSTGPALVFSKNGRAPRHGQSFEIVSAAGGIEGTFGSIASFQGVLRPELTYGETSITADLRAGKFVDIIDRNDATSRAFAQVLDTLRDGSYSALYDFYGMVDLMDGASLTAYFNGLAPNVGIGTNGLQQRQSRKLTSAVADRLSVMGSSEAGGRLAMVGAPETMRMGLTALSGQRNVRMGIADLAPTGGSATQLPEGMSGFVSGGTFGARDAGSASFAEGGQVGSYFGMGLEHRVSDKASFGVAVGYADGREVAGADSADLRTTQISAYGAYDLGSNVYVGGIASLETIENRSERGQFDGRIGATLRGASDMQRYSVSGEVGMNVGVAEGLTLTPRASLAYDTMSLDGFTEQGNQAALAIDDLATQSLTARGGFKLAGSHALSGGWTLTPQLQADYVHRISGSNDGLTVRFAAADHVGIALPLGLGEGSWGEMRGGLTLDNGTVSFGAGFETAVERRSIRDDRAMVEVGVRF